MILTEGVDVFANGWGSRFFKCVSFRNDRELIKQCKEALSEGERIYVKDCPKSGGNHGSEFRCLINFGRGRWALRTIEWTEEKEALEEKQQGRPYLGALTKARLKSVADGLENEVSPLKK